MALNNPAFNDPAFQDPRAVSTYPGGPQAANLGRTTQFSTAQAASTDVAANARLEGMYAAPPAGAIETGRMTVEDTVVKTVALFAVLVAFSAIGWVWTYGGLAFTGTYTSMPMIIGGLVGFVLAMVNIFKKKVSPPLVFAYAAFQGLFVGGISAFFEVTWSGIVLQATLATLVVVGVTLALFASGKIRASRRATKIFLIAMVGYLVFSLINVFMMMFGATDSAFGLSSQVEILGIPLGLLMGPLVIIMGAYSLVLDFDLIQQGVRNGAPREFAWRAAFGIMVTVIWLYVEILRIIAIARGSN